MSITIDYYLSLNSPWTYMGSALFAEIAKRNGATVNVKPAKFGAIFEKTGGLPLPKRSPERQAYRLVDMKRWREVRNLPLTLQPKYFPSDDSQATRLVIAAKLAGKDAHRLSLELGRALWEREESSPTPQRYPALPRAQGSTRRRCVRPDLRMPSSTNCTTSTPRRRWRPACSAHRAMCCPLGKSSGARTGWNCWSAR